VLDRWRAGSLVLLLWACGDGTSGEAPPALPALPLPEATAPALPEGAAAYDLPVAVLRRRVEALGRLADGGDAGAAREAARGARLLALRSPAEEALLLERARGWLRAAAEDETEGCEAALEHVVLVARDLGRASEAHALATATATRFDGACAERADALAARLAPFRTAAEADASLAGWAAARAGDDASLLEALTVHGRGQGDDATARIVFRLDRVTAYEATEDDGGLRLVLRGTRTGDGVEARTAVGRGGVEEVQLAPAGDDLEARLVLDPRSRARAFLLPEPFRLIVDVEPRGAPRAPDTVRRVVLDPGHGGDDFGARSGGLRESDLALDLCRRARTLLLRRLPDVQVVLTREDDTLVSLEQRTALANAIGADLFVSVHLNGSDEPVRRGGVTTFVLDTSNDRQALRLAARENGTTTGEVGELAHLLARLHRQDQAEGSRALATQLHRGLLAAGRRELPRLHDRGVRSAMFHVLVGARMPAVLVEASFLTFPPETEALQRPGYRQALAEGLVAGLVAYAGR
jgi:N-acetylmuramoyl-L-alanine amidase